ncbi:MAG: DNA alkylation repair protein, partial [Steroidobacteraceae bacterium]
MRLLCTDEHKPYLEIAPWVIAVFLRRFMRLPGGRKVKHYYTDESVGIATGLLIAAVHTAGLVSLTHTPSPMGFMNEILDRPKDLERPYMLLVVGYPAADAVVPDIHRLPLKQIATFRGELASVGRVTFPSAMSASTPPVSAAAVQRALRKLASRQRAAGSARFFKCGKGQYGEGDRFIGVTVPQQRAVARRFEALPVSAAFRLLRSKVHEDRATALLILVRHSREERMRESIRRRYLQNLKYVNNWDLVD